MQENFLNPYEQYNKYYQETLTENFFKVDFNRIKKTGLSLSFKDKLGVAPSKQNMYNSGIYGIWKFCPDAGMSLEYIGESHGQSEGGMRYRIYRFGRQVLGINRHDEHHPAAERFKAKYPVNTLQNVYTTFCAVHPEVKYKGKNRTAYIQSTEKYLIGTMKPCLNTIGSRLEWH